MSFNNSSSGGMGILGWLLIVFVTLKLTGHIDWSWWYVTMPFWGGLVLGLIAIVILAFVSVYRELNNK